MSTPQQRGADALASSGNRNADLLRGLHAQLEHDLREIRVAYVANLCTQMRNLQDATVRVCQQHAAAVAAALEVSDEQVG